MLLVFRFFVMRTIIFLVVVVFIELLKVNIWITLKHWSIEFVRFRSFLSTFIEKSKQELLKNLSVVNTIKLSIKFIAFFVFSLLLLLFRSMFRRLKVVINKIFAIFTIVIFESIDQRRKIEIFICPKRMYQLSYQREFEIYFYFEIGHDWPNRSVGDNCCWETEMY